MITFCIFLYSIFSAFSLNQTHVITYQESSDIDYKVYLKDNSFYEDDYLKKDMSYISTLIDKINATFNYDFRIDKNIDMKFTYDIIGKLTIMDNAGKNTFYEKDFSLINNKVVDMIDTNHCIINENLDINYGYYNSIANDFRNKFGVSTISNFVVTLKINRISIDNDIDDSNDQTMSLTIPLSQREVNIKLSTDTLNNNDSVEKESGIVIVNYLSLIVSVVSFVITIVLLIKLIKKINLIRSRKTEYDKYIEKILKVYDRFIANTKIGPIVNDGDKVIKLNDFQELLDVRDSFKVPINYYNIVICSIKSK